MGDQNIGPQIPTVGTVGAEESAAENEEAVLAEYQRRLAELDREEEERKAIEETAEDWDDSDEEEEEDEEQSDEKEDKEMNENQTDDALSGISEDTILEFLEDLKMNKVEATPSEILTMYQQALTLNPRRADVWIDYCKYLESLHDFPKALEAYEKAIEYHPYETPIAQNALLACEKAKTDITVINGVFEEHEERLGTPETGKQLYTTFIYVQKRLGAPISQLDSIFKKGLTNLDHYFGPNWDADTVYRQNYAYFLYAKKKAPDEAYQIWRGIMKGNGSDEELWLEFVRLERFFGTIENARKLLYEAVNSVDEPIKLFNYFIQFEREEGNREQIDKALLKINKRFHQISQRQAAATAKAPRGSKAKQKVNAPKGTKRTVLGEIEVKPKRRKVEEPLESHKVDKDGFAVPTLPLKAKPRRSDKPKEVAEGSGEADMERNEEREETDMEAESSRASPEGIPDRTVFLSNINFSWKEFDVRKMFPNAIEIRMPMRNKTQSKGYAYVDFGTAEEANEAIAQDGSLKSNGRPIHISAYKPHGKGEKAPFKFATQREDNKLFVRNVHFDTKDEHLKEFFEKFAPVKSVRIVTRPNGLPKGIAYVEFNDEKDAQKGLEADGRKLLGRKVSVAISDPSVKKDPPKKNFTSKETPVLGVAEQRKAVLAFKPRPRVLLDKK